ncbi:MAG: hypothetical protein ACWGNS_03095 [Burkholderiales bacterium]
MPTEGPRVLRRLAPAFGAELGGVDFAQPAEALPIRALYEALLAHQLLLLRGQEVRRRHRWRSRAASARFRCT